MLTTLALAGWAIVFVQNRDKVMAVYEKAKAVYAWFRG